MILKFSIKIFFYDTRWVLIGYHDGWEKISDVRHFSKNETLTSASILVF